MAVQEGVHPLLLRQPPKLGPESTLEPLKAIFLLLTSKVQASPQQPTCKERGEESDKELRAEAQNPTL